jgi:hypothetical protein
MPRDTDSFVSIDPILARRRSSAANEPPRASEAPEAALLVVYAHRTSSDVYLADDRETGESIEVKATELEWFDPVLGWHVA